MQNGKIAQVIGPVVDVSFSEHGGKLPNILDALIVTKANGAQVILECQKHVGEDTVRTVAMDSTDGLSRGMEVVATGSPIRMPIGEQIRGRLFNVVGEAIDGIGTVGKEGGYSIHRDPPRFEDLSTANEV
ncbi:MAG TPA: F0F1 ATP synthase subunit beta, partial [Bacteroidia bacterium]|nr:F0F1 ATP synthase subunit beta [Bacteroidia bacterium]